MARLRRAVAASFDRVGAARGRLSTEVKRSAASHEGDKERFSKREWFEPESRAEARSYSDAETVP